MRRVLKYVFHTRREAGERALRARYPKELAVSLPPSGTHAAPPVGLVHVPHKGKRLHPAGAFMRMRGGLFQGEKKRRREKGGRADFYRVEEDARGEVSLAYLSTRTNSPRRCSHLLARVLTLAFVVAPSRAFTREHWLLFKFFFFSLFSLKSNRDF